MKKNYYKKKFKTKHEWLNNRTIGGSSASALLGLNPYMNAMDIYLASILPQTKEEKKQTKTTSYGSECESYISNIVRLNLDKRYDVKPTKGYEIYYKRSNPYISATLDGRIVDKVTNEKWILEIKTHLVANQADYLTWKNGELPPNYLTQCCHYMGVLDDYVGVLLVAKLLWLDYDTGLVRSAKKGVGEEIIYYWISKESHLQDIKYLTLVEENFVNNHILKRIPPDLDIEILTKKGGSDEGTTVEQR